MSRAGRDPGTPPSPVRRQIVALLVAYSFMTWLNRVSMSVAYDERIKGQFDIPPPAMGWVYSAFVFAYMLCMTPGGLLIDRYGAWLALVVMGFGSALFAALTGAAGHPALAGGGRVLVLLVGIRLLMGALTAPVYPAGSRLVANWLPVARRSGANGMIQGAAAVGIACTFPLFGALIDLVDWPSAFVVSGTVTAVVALAWTVCGADDPSQRRWLDAILSRSAADTPHDPRSSAGDARTAVMSARQPVAELPADEAVAPPLWRHRSLILLTASYGAIGYVEYLFFFWMHYYFEGVLRLGTVRSRHYAAVLMLALAGGMVLGGFLADRLRARDNGRRRYAIVPAVGMCAGAVLLVLGTHATKVAWIVTLLALALAAVGAAEAPVWTVATELGGRRGGTAAAVCNTGANLGGLVSPVVTQLVSDWFSRQGGLDETTGWRLGIGLGSVVAIAGAVPWLWIRPAERPDESEGDTPGADQRQRA